MLLNSEDIIVWMINRVIIEKWNWLVVELVGLLGVQFSPINLFDWISNHLLNNVVHPVLECGQIKGDQLCWYSFL